MVDVGGMSAIVVVICVSLEKNHLLKQLQWWTEKDVKKKEGQSENKE